MESLLQWITAYGYWGLFTLLFLGIAGLPVPDETLLVFSGYLISQGRLHPLWTFVVAAAGSIGGISVSYYLGRSLGYGFVHKYGRYLHLTEARVAAVHRWFCHVGGHWALTLGYYIPGVRHFTAFVAGMSRLEYPTFAFFAYGGACLWVASFLALGYFVGEKWEQAFELVHRYLLLIVPVLAIAGLVWWLRWRNRNRTAL